MNTCFFLYFAPAETKLDSLTRLVSPKLRLSNIKEEVNIGHNLTQGILVSEKEYVKAVYCHPAYLTYMQTTS